jgi:predicted Rossmann fold flavoprotein
LAQFSWEDAVSLFSGAGIRYEERDHGKLFSFDGKQFVDYLQTDVNIALKTSVNNIERVGEKWTIRCNNETNFHCKHLVIATGGLSYPQLDVSDFGYRFAQQLGLAIESPSPALVRLDFPKNIQKNFTKLAGISLPVTVTAGEHTITDEILFTHYGLSGPALLTASLWWQENTPLQINWLPGINLKKIIADNQSRKVKDVLTDLLPKRFAEIFSRDCSTPLANMSKSAIDALVDQLTGFTFIPENTVGYPKAEVTRGGVATRFLSSKTMEVKHISGVYFIGEVVDVTGELGGYNLHWAWASAMAAAKAINITAGNCE